MNATMTVNAVKNGISRHDDEVKAVEELAEQILQHDSELVLFFTSTKYDLDRLGDAMNRTFPGVAAGCTTAGEIGPDGYSEKGIVGLSIGPGPIRVHPYCIPGARSKPLRSEAAFKAGVGVHEIFIVASKKSGQMRIASSI